MIGYIFFHLQDKLCPLEKNTERVLAFYLILHALKAQRIEDN